MFELTLYYIMWTVLVYSFLGWCGEVIFAACVHGKFVNRGFLFGPVCPIYGFGMLAVLACLTPVSGNLPVLFVGSIILATALEFVTGFALDKLFHQKWWDYSSFPFNIMGYVCPLFSLLWGLGCVLMVRVVHPLIDAGIRLIPHTLGIVLLVVFLTILSADIITTAIGLTGFSAELRMLDEAERALSIVSDEIGAHLADGTIDMLEKSSPLRAKGEAAVKKYREIIEKRRSMTHRRIMRAFPNLNNGERLRESYEKLRERLRVWERKK